jgi:hypothetical protein
VPALRPLDEEEETMREMYAMDVGRGMGICGRVVETVRFVSLLEPMVCVIEYVDGSATECHPHDRLDVDEETPQREALVESARDVFRRHYPDFEAAGLVNPGEPG